MINESQYRDMFLNETMHYPKFLDTFKLDVGTRVCEKLKDMASNGIEHTSFTVSLNNEYVDTIEVDASLDFDCDPSDKGGYFASYFNHYDRCKDGRIHEPTLTVVCPAKGGGFDVSKLFYRVSHELTHLYDDWNSVRKFLDNLKDDVSANVTNHISDMIKRCVTEEVVTIDVDCEYADKITVHINLDSNKDVRDKKAIHAEYFNSSDVLVDGKIDKPTIRLFCPVNGDVYNYFAVKYRLSHELTHLYDDWNSIRNGNGGICRSPQNMDTTEFLKDSATGAQPVLKNFAFLAYMSLNTERQSFLSQTVQELEGLGCNQWNYREKLKETDTYNNITKSHEGVVNCANNMTDSDLHMLNLWVTSQFPKARIPKMNAGGFDAERYRAMILKWAERVYHETMKSYGSVVQYYIDNLKEEWNRNANYFILD